jgi:23S rRNA (uracil1939-C5)-methyltransferase
MLEPGCSVAAQCGGCPFIANTAEQSRAMHEGRLRDALRLRGAPSLTSLPIDWVTVSQPKGYRRRLRLRILDNVRIGFFNAGKSVDCAVLTVPLRELLHRLLQTAPDYPLALASLHHIELREPDLDGIASAFLVKSAPATALARGVLDQLGEWLRDIYWVVADESPNIPSQRLALPTVWHFVPIGSFLQVNQAINDLLVADLVSGAKQRGAASFCDLYAGSGNFTLPLLASGLDGVAVELDPESRRAAFHAIGAQNLPRGGFETGDAGAFAARAASAKQSFDLAIVDPPRAGIRENLASMATLARKHFVYCSCNLDTLARDIAELHRAGFEVESMTLYDMFPGTAHVECLVWLRTPARRIG